MEKILIVGNSHSGDTFWLLQKVFEEHYDKDVTLGYLYYSGCTVAKHLNFALNKEPVYAYRRNFTGKDQGVWDDLKGVTIDVALTDQEWDIIVFHAGRGDYREDCLNLADRRKLEEYINQRVTNPHIFMWNTSWPGAGKGPVFDPSWPVKPPAGYIERMKQGIEPAEEFENKLINVRKYILTDTTYKKVMCPGAAIMYALLTLKRPQTDLYRDYTHLSEFGRLIASYAFYTQYTGKMVDAIKIDVVPARLRSTRLIKEGDVTVTQEMKDVILEAVGYAFEHAFEVPTQK